MDVEDMDEGLAIPRHYSQGLFFGIQYYWGFQPIDRKLTDDLGITRFNATETHEKFRMLSQFD